METAKARYRVLDNGLLSAKCVTLIDAGAEIVGRRYLIKLHILLALLASGDPMSIRAILPQPLLSFRQAMERALTTK